MRKAVGVVEMVGDCIILRCARCDNYVLEWKRKDGAWKLWVGLWI